MGKRGTINSVVIWDVLWIAGFSHALALRLNPISLIAIWIATGLLSRGIWARVVAPWAMRRLSKYVEEMNT